MRQPAVITWGISSFFGWGVYGLNLALAWASDPHIDPIALLPIDRTRLAVDPLRMASLDRFLTQSAKLAERLRDRAGHFRFNMPVLLRDNLTAPANTPEGTIDGKPTIGIVFFEDTQLGPDAVARVREMSIIVTGSSWNERILREHGLTNVRTVLQGIDPTLFHPAPRMGVMSDRFKVFSGGKLELRKGQDIVAEAFARFARSHPDAVLITAWHSPWPRFARGLDASGRAAPVTYDRQGNVDVKAWAMANGIADQQFIDLGTVANAHLPPILREMDAALFTNRSEGGTNLVAMECMACGVPTILSANTGHLDLMDERSCYPLLRQRGVAGFGAAVGGKPGWGDTDTEEVVEVLERIYSNRAEARRIGAGGAAKLAHLTWARTAAALKEVIRAVS
jgi:glycosyltransferase involved in cell wall biosynthesis